ncbi:MAG TPA: hypothetical protein VJR02_23130 [Pyrinomonadaceae bacterium]|nr:hypothetical protein [Pyrinomonadaceae bacterium]
MSDVLQKVAGAFHSAFVWLKDELTEDTIKAIYVDLGLDPKTAKPLVAIPEETLGSIARYRDEVNPTVEAFLETLDDIIELFEIVASFTDDEGRRDDAIAHALLGVFVTNYARQKVPWAYWFVEPVLFLENIATSDPIVKGHSLAYLNGLKRIGEFALDLGFRDSSKAFNQLMDAWANLAVTLHTNFPIETEADARRLSDFTLQPLAILLAIVESERLKTLAESPSPFAKRDVAVIADSIYGWDAPRSSTTPIADQIAERTLTFSIKDIGDDTAAGVEVERSLNGTMTWVPRVHGGPGLLVGFGGAVQIEADLGADWNLIIKLSSAIAMDFLIRNINTRPLVNGPSDAKLEVTLEQPPDESALPNVFPDRKGTRLEFERLSLSGEISNKEAGLKLIAQNAALVIAANKDADGFVNEILPTSETRISFDLGVGLSTERGIYLKAAPASK